MPNILHRISTTKATQEELFRAVSTKDGFATWWTERMGGTDGVGGVLEFNFSEGGLCFEIIELDPPAKATLRCVTGPPEWIGTEIEFRISREDDDTVLLFSHRGWREEIPFMNHCSTQWASFLLGLKEHCEMGQGRPFGPNYTPVSNWSPPTPDT